MSDDEDLLEEGRKLASQRDNLIAQGVDPADLAIPLAPLDADAGYRPVDRTYCNRCDTWHAWEHQEGGRQ